MPDSPFPLPPHLAKQHLCSSPTAEAPLLSTCARLLEDGSPREGCGIEEDGKSTVSPPSRPEKVESLLEDPPAMDMSLDSVLTQKLSQAGAMDWPSNGVESGNENEREGSLEYDLDKTPPRHPQPALDKSLDSVLTQKLSQADAMDRRSTGIESGNENECAQTLEYDLDKTPPRMLGTEREHGEDKAAPGVRCPGLELPSGLLRARTDCDYWDEASHAGLSTARSRGQEGDPRQQQRQLSGRSNYSGPVGQCAPILQRQQSGGRSGLGSPNLRGAQGLGPKGEETSWSLDRNDVVRGGEFSWVRGELVGRGSLGCVWKALNRASGQLMAVKEVIIDQRDQSDDRFRTSLQNEIDLYKDLEHPHIVSYLGNDYQDGRLFIYLEYMPGGSIAQVLSQFGPLDEPLIAQYAQGLLLGLEYLHSRNPPVLHRDIKGANILVGLDRMVKLSDFGCSKRTEGTMQHTLRGSVPWMAPEVMKQAGYGRKADVWSLGCVLIEMSTASAPWGSFDNHLAAMVRIAMSEETPPVPGHLSPACSSLVSACTRRNPEERPSAFQLLSHEFVTSPGLGATSQDAEDSWGA